MIVYQDYELCMLLFHNIFERPCSDLQLSLRYICIGNGKDFSGKLLVGGLPLPPRYSCILSNGKDLGGGDVSDKDF